MARGAGYSWVIEAGLGDSLIEPKLTWHSIPGNKGRGKKLFPETSFRLLQDPHYLLFRVSALTHQNPPRQGLTAPIYRRTLTSAGPNERMQLTDYLS
jgi:hypothetical protein